MVDVSDRVVLLSHFMFHWFISQQDCKCFSFPFFQEFSKFFNRSQNIPDNDPCMTCDSFGPVVVIFTYVNPFYETIIIMLLRQLLKLSIIITLCVS